MQTLAFAPGDRAKTVAVNIIDDTRPESGESLQLFLSNPVGAQLGTTLAFASMSDDDSRFDSAYYVERNPDVAAAKIDPRTHYLSSGWAEGRDPNANVDLASVNGLDYIASYGDLMGAFGPNKAAGYRHFATAGMFEGRYTTFDGLEYIASYQDLMNVLGANADAGASHYIQTGRAQGRTITFNGLEYVASHADPSTPSMAKWRRTPTRISGHPTTFRRATSRTGLRTSSMRVNTWPITRTFARSSVRIPTRRLFTSSRPGTSRGGQTARWFEGRARLWRRRLALGAPIRGDAA